MTKKMTATKKSSGKRATKTVSAVRATRARQAGKAAKTIRRERTVKETISNLNQQQVLTMVKDVATKSLHLGLGLGVHLIDTIQEIELVKLGERFYQDVNSVIDTAINKGAKLERQQRARFVSFQTRQFNRIGVSWAASK